VQAEGFRLFGREDEGHLGCTLAFFTAHQNVGTTVWMSQDLVVGNGF
jgi:hypothetical protein